MMQRLDSVGALKHALQSAGAQPGAALRTDTRALRTGDVFVAWPGAARDARHHLDDAFARGAVCAVIDAAGAAAYEVSARVLRVSDLQAIAGGLADAWYGHPSRHMTVLAVTGTNGKTSCALWAARALAAAGRPCGVIGTLGLGMPDALRSTGLTTPDPVQLHHALADMRDRGVAHCALEASSIGVQERRLDGVRLHAVGFTNLTQDHLDYHGSMASYAAAKRRLFDWPALRAAVINVDDPTGTLFAGHALQKGLHLQTVSLSQHADWALTALSEEDAGMRLRVRCGARLADLTVPLLGRFNASNLLVVCGLLATCGLDFDAIVSSIATVTAPPGRLQGLGGIAAPLVVVDYAHTPDAIGHALQALRGVAQRRGGKLWCVLGAGGDRDRSKRAPMAAAAEAVADRIVLTSDNPRSEIPQEIVSDLMQGLVAPARTLAVTDRAQAIAQTVSHADAEDVVLVAGKGHETTQEVRGVKRPFSDVFHVRLALAQRGAGCFNLRELHAWVGGRLRGNPLLALHGVSTDTRTLRAGELFVALKGERFDANDLVRDAVAAGAGAVLTERSLADFDVPGIEVSDSLAAFGRLARAWRRQQAAMPLIAVTGSNGKTTVTQMLASILAAWQGEDGRLATQGNFNNEIGLPLTLLRLRPGHLAGVVELGMNHPGEVGRLAAICEPTVGLVNNAQREHQEFMETVEAVALENGSVIESLPPDGVVVYPADDPQAPIWRAQAGARTLMRFCLRDAVAGAGVLVPTADAEVHGVVEALGDGMVLHLQTPTLTAARVRLQLIGRHNAHNALAASAAALAAGAPLSAVIDGLEAFRAVPGRMQRIARRWSDGHALLLIDDTYNANPDSVRAAIDALAALPGRRLLVLGDMGEVGTQGAAFHAEVGAHAAACGLDAVWCVGTQSAAAADAAAAGGVDASRVAAVEAIDTGAMHAFDAVLVKGSRFMRMERIVAAVQQRTAPAADPAEGQAHVA